MLCAIDGGTTISCILRKRFLGSHADRKHRNHKSQVTVTKVKGEAVTARVRYAIVGTGSRAEMYVRAILLDHADVAELVALADVNPGRLEHYARLVASLDDRATTPSLWRADQVAELVASGQVDRVIVTSPDYTHAGVVVTALRSGADVIVEKPLTINAESAAEIARAVDETGRSVVATFNYRYSPRNSELKRVIASGAIGTPTSVHFEWVLDTAHGADYFRRWHRDKANSGGLLVHKASHHFDLVNWWIDDVPVRVFASGGLRFYGDKNAAARGLTNRPARGTDAQEPDPFLLDLRKDEKLKQLYLDNEQHDGYRRDQDVFSPGITIEDNLSLVVDYASGASMSYSLNAHSPWEGYRIAVNGTEGRAELTVVERSALPLEADGHTIVDPSAVPDDRYHDAVRPREEHLVLQRHWEKAQEIPIPVGEGGHGGGDTIMLRDVLVGHDHDPLGRPADYIDGMKAIAVGIAANRSLATGMPVAVADLGLGVDLSVAGAVRATAEQAVR
jgi:predicted dehydrogenase